MYADILELDNLEMDNLLHVSIFKMLCDLLRGSENVTGLGDVESMQR